MYVCMYVCMYVYTYIYIYIHNIHIHIHLTRCGFFAASGKSSICSLRKR